MKYVKVTSPDVNNGIGNRATLWVSGCKHNCEGCHNKWLQDYTKGKPVSEAKSEIYEALSHSYIRGLTISGGDPLYQTEESLDELYNLISEVRSGFPDKDIWLFSGYTLEEVSDNKPIMRILDVVDYFVDGRFKIDLKDARIPFRGSSNQRIWGKNKNGNFEIVDDEQFKN